jgi:hypothetical protein
MSKHWDPSWRKETVVVKADEGKAILRARNALRLGEVPEAFRDPKPCFKDGLSRMAILGPDFGAVIRAPRRNQAAPFQRRLGRFTWYFICTRPRIRAVAGECGIVGDYAHMAFDVSKDDGVIERLSFKEPQEDPGVQGISVVEDGQSLQVHSSAGVWEQDSALVAQQMHSRRGWSASDFDLEIRYIGRARGTQSEVSALDRLGSHDKYQLVLEELQQGAKRNRDPWIVLSSGTTMETMTFTSTEPSAKYQEELEQADARARRILSTSVRIDLVEAMLINYFKPTLNTHHVANLDLKGSLIEACREAGLTGVAVAISSNNLGVAYYTAHRPPSPHGQLKVCL